jgi:hypothetical protein
MPPTDDWFDEDIAAMDLSYAEKSGLQIHRNYTNSFENRAIENFRDMLSREPLDLSHLLRLLTIISSEDPRFLPVILCGYADDLLKVAFLNTLPKDIPGGVDAMLGGYGPLSDLSKRIRMAFAFDVISKDLATELDRVREVRNRVSHDWDIKPAATLLAHPKLAAMFPIENELMDNAKNGDPLGPDSVFRIRLIWLAGRLTYEAAAYHQAKGARLSPTRALYENGGTTWLTAISNACMAATKQLIA